MNGRSRPKSMLAPIQAIFSLSPYALCRKGKRGRLRVVKYYLSADHQIWFFTLYDKDEAADLTSEQKKVLEKAIQAELEARRRKP